MSKGGQPNLTQAAQAQGAANQAAAVSSFELNNGNETTPYGQRTLTQIGTYPDGTPQYSQDVTLNPSDQARLDQTRQLQSQVLNAAPGMVNQVQQSLATPFQTQNLAPIAQQVDTTGNTRLDLSGLPPMQMGVGSTDAIRNQTLDAAWNQYASRAIPMQQMQTEALDTRLANMGGGIGNSEGANRQQAALRMSQGDQNNQALMSAILASGNAAQQEQGMQLAGANLYNSGIMNNANLAQTQAQFNNTANQQDIQNAFANAGLTNQARQQGLTEEAQLRQMPLNELMAMISGTQVQSPQFGTLTPTSVAPAPLYNAAAQQSQNAAGSYNSLLSGIAGIGGSLLGGPTGSAGSQLMASLLGG